VRNRHKQAFKQAPWRVEMRSAGGTMLLLTSLLTIGGMYLTVSSKVAQAGRQVMTYEARRQELLQANADMRSKLAELTIPERLLERAQSLGFKPAGPDDIEYIEVQGYTPQAAFVAPRPLGSIEPGPAGLSPAFTETLGAWLSRLIGVGGSRP